MDRQEINLYTLEFRQEDQPLSSKRVAQSAVATFVVLMIIEGLTAWGYFRNQQQVVDLQQQQKLVSDRLATLKRTQPISQRPKLEVEIRVLREQVQRREELKVIISGQNLGNAKGFSNHLEAMAKQTVTEVALSKFRFLQGGGYVELEGNTRLPEAVPLYLQNLRQEDSFTKVRFGVLTISHEQKAKEQKDGEQSSRREMSFSVGKHDGGAS